MSFACHSEQPNIFPLRVGSYLRLWLRPWSVPSHAMTSSHLANTPIGTVVEDEVSLGELVISGQTIGSAILSSGFDGVDGIVGCVVCHAI